MYFSWGSAVDAAASSSSITPVGRMGLLEALAGTGLLEALVLVAGTGLLEALAEAGGGSEVVVDGTAA